MKRGWQLKQTLTWNMVNTLPYGNSCKFFLILFNKDDPDTIDVLEWLGRFQPGIDKKKLYVAT